MPRPSRADRLNPEPDLLCDARVVHLEQVQRAREALPDPDRFSALAGLFAALGDPTRLRMVGALAAGELCVCDLAAVAGTSESAISHHLRLLRDLGLVRSRREGRLAFYALDDAHVTTLYAQALDHVSHRDPTP